MPCHRAAISASNCGVPLAGRSLVCGREPGSTVVVVVGGVVVDVVVGVGPERPGGDELAVRAVAATAAVGGWPPPEKATNLMATAARTRADVKRQTLPQRTRRGRWLA